MSCGIDYEQTIDDRRLTTDSECVSSQARKGCFSLFIVFLHACVLCASCVKKINAKDAIVATVNKRTFNIQHSAKSLLRLSLFDSRTYILQYSCNLSIGSWTFDVQCSMFSLSLPHYSSFECSAVGYSSRTLCLCAFVTFLQELRLPGRLI
jgi:hypothetical protein